LEEFAMTIYFYSTKDKYGSFSNFSHHPIFLDGYKWLTTEHYFQANKFIGHPDYHELCAIISPKDVAKAGRDRSRPLRSDWEQVKDDVMRKCVLRKFQTHVDIRELLLSTGDEQIVEHTVNDKYWADGGDGSGKNMLGIILMETRLYLKNLPVQVSD
jgi:ribA/ribD-fused uncharacterized protein